jgi:GntR family transcriptional regulator/MocR family aminotransferase
VTTQLTLEAFIDSGQFEKHLNRMKIIYKSKRDLIISKLRDAFGDLIVIKGDDAGLHFLVEFKTLSSEKELIQKAKDVDVRVYGLSEYYANQKYCPSTPTLIFGYSHLSEEALVDSVALLKSAWKNMDRYKINI